MCQYPIALESRYIPISLIQTKNLIRLVEAAVMFRSGGARQAALDCSVMEEDWQRGQCYTAHWHSLNLVPHIHQLVTISLTQISKLLNS